MESITLHSKFTPTATNLQKSVSQEEVKASSQAGMKLRINWKYRIVLHENDSEMRYGEIMKIAINKWFSECAALFNTLEAKLSAGQHIGQIRYNTSTRCYDVIPTTWTPSGEINNHTIAMKALEAVSQCFTILFGSSTVTCARILDVIKEIREHNDTLSLPNIENYFKYLSNFHKTNSMPRIISFEQFIKAVRV